MHSPKSGNFTFIALILAFAAVHAFHIWRLPVLPFIDLPNHLAEAYVSGNHGIHTSGVYYTALSAYQPGSLHALFCGLFGSVELGNRIFYTSYLLLIPLGMLGLIRHSKGDGFFALFSLCWVYSYSVFWGFAGFTFAIPCVLISLWSFVSYLSSPKPHWFAVLTIGLLVTYYAHVLAFLFLSTVLILSLICLRGTHWRIRVVSILSILPVVLLCVLWTAGDRSWSQQGTLTGFLVEYYRFNFASSFLARIPHLFSDDNAALAAGLGGHFVALIWSLGLVVLLAVSIARGHLKMNDLSGGDVPYRVATIFLFTALGCVMFLPNSLPGQIILFERFSVFVWLSLIWRLSRAVDSAPYRARVRYSMVALTLLHALLWSHYFARFDTLIAEPLAHMLHREELHGASLSAIMTDNSFRGRPLLIHVQNYQMVWNDGITPTKASEYRFRILQKRDTASVPRYTEWVGEGTNIPGLVNEYRSMDFLLLRGTKALDGVLPMAEYELIAAEGGWNLLGRRKVNAAPGFTREP